MIARRLLIGGSGSFTPVAPTFPPTDNSWTRSGTNPVVTADEAWDQNAVVEPCVTYESGFKLWYRGGWSTQAIGYATSSDGVTWTKSGSNPIYGQGGSGQSGDVALPWVTKVGSTYYLSAILSPFTVGNAMQVATSSDGVAWTNQSTSISLPPGTNLWGNRVVWVEGSTWYMLCEAVPTGSFWRIYLYSSSDGLTWSIQNSGTAYGSLQIASGGMYGGPRFANVNGTLTPKVGSTYHLWYHAAPGSGNLPTNIYHSTSTDLSTDSWTTPNLVLSYGVDAFEVDQVAGPVPMVAGATSYLFYDGDDNTAMTAAIGLATA